MKEKLINQNPGRQIDFTQTSHGKPWSCNNCPNLWSYIIIIKIYNCQNVGSQHLFQVERWCWSTVICSQTGLVLETIGEMTMSSLSFGLFFADYNFLTVLKTLWKGRKKSKRMIFRSCLEVKTQGCRTKLTTRDGENIYSYFLAEYW